MSYYTYQHVPGWGRDDHMASEIIARAATHLGIGGASREVAAAAGLASHSAPHVVEVRLPVERGVANRMRGALRRAKSEVARSQVRIDVLRLD